MSIADDNVLVRGFSGKFGDQVVFRRRNGKTIMANVPGKRTSKPAGRQRECCDNFTAASKWAKMVLKDPERLAAYKAKVTGLQNAFNMAVADYLQPPAVTGINGMAYHGQAGDVILVTASDVFKVKEVMVEIRGPKKTTIEHGPCTPDPSGSYWQYVAVKDAGSTRGLILKAVAFDSAGNRGEMEIKL